MRKWIIIILSLIVFGIIGYNYIYQDHRDIGSEKPAFTISSEQILEEFQINSIDAEAKYLDKTIEVFGTITKIQNQTLVLDNAVFCQFQNQLNSNLQISQSITLKGRFLGFDDLLEEIKLDQCYLIIQ
jgi:hypothetical protein